MLGLATGSTPVGVYDELVRLHREEGLSFANVMTFNLDEYYPMQPNELQSYVRFMREHLFDLVDIPAGNWHVPDGTLPIEQVADYCTGTKSKSTRRAGSIFNSGHRSHGAHRLQRAGLRQGKPHAADHARPRHADRRGQRFLRPGECAAAGDHDGRWHDSGARKIIMLAFGEHKAPIIAKAVEGEISSSIAASFLQEHPNAEVVLDEAAADALTRYRTPWLLGPVEWDEKRGSQGGDLAGPQARQADPQAHRPGLQRRRLAGLAGRARAGVRHQRQGVPTPAVDDHRLAGRQAGACQAAGRSIAVARRYFPEARARFFRRIRTTT